MKSRGLTIALVVLAALLGLLYWSNRHPRSETTPIAGATPPEPPPNILTLVEGDINKLELKKRAGDQIALAKDSNGKWQITAPKTFGVDDAAISGILSTVSSLSADRLVEANASNVGQYGLATPTLEVDVTDKSATHKLFIGDDTPTGNAAYARLDGDPRVFTIASGTKTGLDKSLNDLRDKRLITADADKITRLELTLKGQTIEFSRDKQQWQILKPGPLRADATKVDDLVRKITDAKLDATAPTDDKAAASFGSGTVVATAKVTTDSGTQQLEVRKVKDDYYAKSSVVEGVNKVASDLGQGLDKKLADFRDKKVFGLSDVGKLEIHDGAKTHLLSKNGDDWWSSDGKKYDKTGADALTDKVRNLEASDFADTGFGAVALQISLTSSDGKRVEKLSLSKGDKNTFARREGESSLYLLDANLIADIQKLAGDLKPATGK